MKTRKNAVQAAGHGRLEPRITLGTAPEPCTLGYLQRPTATLPVLAARPVAERQQVVERVVRVLHPQLLQQRRQSSLQQVFLSGLAIPG